MAFSELRKLHRLMDQLSSFFKIEKIGEIEAKDQNLPIYGIVVGSSDNALPTFGLFGGVHGVEKIGTHIVINHLKYLNNQLKWDESLQDLFTKCRLVSIPIVNPGGMCFDRRSNMNGVDLMRNAPIQAEKKYFNPVSGQFFSSLFPWYRGNFKKMEKESDLLVKFVKKEMFSSSFAITLDVHSGFGMKDRIWYPYSRTKEKFPLENEILCLAQLFKESLPHHNYIMEPQTNSYIIYGDLWDYLFDDHFKNHDKKIKFLPLTLELGSWRWVKKNIFQAFKMDGYYNPIKSHRYDRAMRRHRLLLDFILKSTAYHKNWI